MYTSLHAGVTVCAGGPLPGAPLPWAPGHGDIRGLQSRHDAAGSANHTHLVLVYSEYCNLYILIIIDL